MFNSEASFRNPSEKPRSGEMSIEGLRCSCSFRSATDYRSPINGLSEINRFELFYKHCIPTGFSDRLLKVAESLVRWMFLKKNVRILAELKTFRRSAADGT